MKKLTLEITEEYAAIITLTVIGGTPYEMKASTGAFDLRKTDKITISNDGKMIGTAADATPTADVVEGVRCKDCIYWTGGDYCANCIADGLKTRYENEYCSRGKRRE